MRTARLFAVPALGLALLGIANASASAGCPFAALACSSKNAADSSKNIVETASAAGKFKTLIAAAQAAGLVDTLTGPGPFTVFAPTDEAFTKLPNGTVENLLKPENREKLASILKYHVVPGRISLAKALEVGQGKTVLGPNLSITFAEGSVTVGTAKLVTADVAASNGTIHIIDTVLLPPATTSESTATASGKADELIELAIERGVPLFNAKQPEACAAVYEVTARALLTLPTSTLNSASREKLTVALARIKTDSSFLNKAWTLRHALDDVYESLAPDED
jgi:transforming growth factor-beta-induced protein